jgi:hypothetical protein
MEPVYSVWLLPPEDAHSQLMPLEVRSLSQGGHTGCLTASCGPSLQQHDADGGQRG